MNKGNNKNLNSELLYLNDSSQELGGEIKLWRAVIERALEDLGLPKSNKRYRLWHRTALKWLDSNNQDFITVCQYATAQPQHILKIANKILNK